MGERQKGAALAIGLAALSAVIALVMTPILVRGLGIADFGRYSLALSILAAFMLFDGGMGDALVRFAVRHRAQGSAALSRFLGQALPLYGAAVALLLVAGIAGSWLAGRMFPEFSPDSLAALALAGAAFAILGNPFRAIMSACERFVAARLMEIAAAILTAAASVVVVLRGGGAEAAFCVVVLSLAGLTLARAAYVFARLGVRPVLSKMPKPERAEILRLAAPVLLALLVEALYWRIDLLLAGAMLGPAAVAIYAIALQFQKHMMRLSAALSRVMVPATIAGVDEGLDGAAIARQLAKVARIQALVLGTVLIALCAFGDTFLTLWLGPEFSASYPIMVIVLVPFCLDQVGNLRNTVLQAKGLYWQKALQALAIALANGAATVALMPVFGLLGAAAASAGGLLAGLVASNRLAARKAGVHVGLFYRAVFKSVALPLCVTAAIAAAIDHATGDTRAGLLVAALCYGAGTLLIIFALALSPSERKGVFAFAAKAVRRVKQARPHRPLRAVSVEMEP